MIESPPRLANGALEIIHSPAGMRNWWKHQQKLMNAGGLKPERVEMFRQLLALGEEYRHVNQYQ